MVGAILLDLTKAFDSINHNITGKLPNLNFSGVGFMMTLISVAPSIHSLQFIQFKVLGGSAMIGQEGFTLDRSPICCRPNTVREPSIDTVNLESSVNLTPLTVGGSWSTQRDPTQTWGEHRKARWGIQTQDFLAVTQQS